MPNPGAPAPHRSSVEDSYLEMLSETLEGLEMPARGQFLQRFFRTLTHLDLQETQAVQLWDEVLLRRRELADALAKPVSIRTALSEVLSSSNFFRLPVIIEYDELKKLQLNAVTDPLTGLSNRRLFSETFEKELNRARRYGHPLSLVILDLHKFKEVNDRHGHLRGDEVLRAAAETLKKALRTSDAAYRIGGDEFALLLPQTDSVQALALSKRIGVVFAETLDSLDLTVEVSMDHGLATYPLDGEHADQLVRVADERLYRLKHANHRKSEVIQDPVDPPLETPPPPAANVQTIPSENLEIPSEKSQPSSQSPISQSSSRTESSLADAVTASSSSSPQVAPVVITKPAFTIQRKAERVSMAGTNAYATLGDQSGRRARVLDLGFGGVALELEQPEALPESLLAVLHVPILPPVRVNLRPVWTRKTSEGSFRIGCCFVS